MSAYVVRRLMILPVVILLISVLLFALVRVAGDPVELFLGEDATQEAIDRLRATLGLDAPLHIQYFRFLGDVVQGRFGRSLRFGEEALVLVLERFGATMEVGALAVALAIMISVPAGVISAVKQYSIADYTATWVAILGQAMPNFWLGIMLMLLFSVHLGWLPVSGRGTFAHMVLPAFTLGTASAAVLMRLLRSSMLEVLRQDYITTARSKGLRERVVIFKHAMRNSLIPYVTIIGVQVRVMLAGSIITESVFAWPGMGRLVVQAVNIRDMAVVQAAVFVFALTTILANLMVDFVYVLLDPRIRYQ